MYSFPVVYTSYIISCTKQNKQSKQAIKLLEFKPSRVLRCTSSIIRAALSASGKTKSLDTERRFIRL